MVFPELSEQFGTVSGLALGSSVVFTVSVTIGPFFSVSSGSGSGGQSASSSNVGERTTGWFTSYSHSSMLLSTVMVLSSVGSRSTSV